MASEETQKFVEDMLKRSKEKKDVKPNTAFDGVNPDEISEITNRLREGIQKRKKNF